MNFEIVDTARVIDLMINTGYSRMEIYQFIGGKFTPVINGRHYATESYYSKAW